MIMSIQILSTKSITLKDGRLTYLLTNGVQEVLITSDKLLTPGLHSIRIQYGSDNSVSLSLDNAVLAKESITARGKYLSPFSSEGVSIGQDLNSLVSKIYDGPFPFNGKVKSLIVEQEVEGNLVKTNP
jgi:hypothetical protein